MRLGLSRRLYLRRPTSSKGPTLLATILGYLLLNPEDTKSTAGIQTAISAPPVGVAGGAKA